MRKFLYCLGVCASISSVAAVDFDREELEERIRPIGQVHIEKTVQEEQQIEQQTMPKAGEKKSPQEIYEHYCIVCHQDGVAGAPKFRNATDWGPRQAKQSLDVLTATAMKGLNAMPPKGTCQECVEEDIKAAIQYMVPQ